MLVFRVIAIALAAACRCCGPALAEDGQVWLVTGTSTNSDTLVVVGLTGRSNGLVVVGGGVLRCPAAVVGGEGTAADNYAVVEGPGARWEITNALTIGSGGSTNRVVVSGGAQLLAGKIRLGLDGESRGNGLQLSGAGSEAVAEHIVVGQWGHGNRIEVSDGATLSSAGPGLSGGGVVGYSGDHNLLRLSGSGAAWHCGSWGIEIGSYGWSNRLEIVDGASVRCAGSLTVAGASGGIGNRLLVSGVGSRLTVTGALKAGFTASPLRLEGGAEVLSGSGLLYGGSGPASVLAGSGTFWQCRSNLIVDWYNTSPTNQVALLVTDGARLVLTNLAGDANLDLRQGEIEVAGATIIADLVKLGGQPYQTAAVRLREGHLQVAGSLNIGPKSRVEGVGNIHGGVTNQGTLSPGGTPGTLRIEGQLTSVGQVETPLDATSVRGASRVQVTGEARLGPAARLAATLATGFRPAWTNAFMVLRWGSRAGVFTNAPPGARLAVGPGSFRVHYTPEGLQLADYFSDLDGDGLDDLWATTLFGHTPLTGAERSADPDGDGLANAAEAVAGTDPHDAASVFRLVAVTPSADGLRLRFTHVPGKWYRVWRSDLLGGWTEVVAPQFTVPVPGVAEWRDAPVPAEAPVAAPAMRFYRVSVE